ncbi:MAG: WYL domain-containing protein [Nanoarchaeota archaeon]
MVSLTKSEKAKLKEILAKSKEKEAKSILDKISKEKKVKYVNDKKEIIFLLRKAFKEKKKVKIQYYSHMSDEVTIRKIAIYKFEPDVITCYCYLREDERIFRTDRIYKASMLDESYKIPKSWQSKSRVWSS